MRNCGFSPQNDLGFSPRPGRCFLLLQVPSCRKSPSVLSDPTGSNTITIRDRIGKKVFCDPIGDCNRIGPSWMGQVKSTKSDFHKRETAPDRSWRKFQVILPRETTDSHIFGPKARANVPIAPFPTDCKSDCTRSGLFIAVAFTPV